MNNEKILENLLEPRAAAYYTKAFARVHKYGWAVPSWNWGCFFFSGFWMLYRKLGLLWFLYIVILAAASRFIVAEYGVIGFYFFYVAFAKVLLPMYVNAYMYWRVGKYIRKAHASGSDPTSAAHRYALASISHVASDNPKVI